MAQVVQKTGANKGLANPTLDNFVCEPGDVCGGESGCGSSQTPTKAGGTMAGSYVLLATGTDADGSKLSTSITLT